MVGHSILAGLNAGLSGIPFWGFDIAGFSGDIPSAELYIRATREGRDFESSMALAREFWTEYNVLVLSGLGMEAERLAEVGEAVYTAAWSADAWQPFPDTLPALKRLKGILSGLPGFEERM